MRIKLGLKTIRPVSVSAPGTAPSPTGAASFMDGLGSTVTAPIIGQKLFINPGTFSGSPTSYDFQIYAGGVAVTGATGGFSASGDAYYIATDSLIGSQLVVKCHGINASGASATTNDSTATTAVADIDLSADAPVLTRTSLSGATPYTVDTALGSKTYAGYTIHRQIASDNGFGTLLYDGQLVLTEAMLQAPLNLDWSQATPVYAEPNNTTYPQFYERDRIEAFTPLNVFKTSSWSATIQKTDGVAPVVWNVSDKTANVVLSNGSLTYYDGGGAGPNSVRATRGLTSGKAYWECHIDAAGGNNRIGMGSATASMTSWSADPQAVLFDKNSAPTFTTGDTVGIAVDRTANLIWISVNNVFTGNPAAGTGGTSISTITGAVLPMIKGEFGATDTAHFATGSFTYTPPTGFAAL